MGFEYIEPSVEELNRRIAGGQVFVQSDLSGVYREYYAPVLPFEVEIAAKQPEISWEQWKTGPPTGFGYTSVPAPTPATPTPTPTPAPATLVVSQGGGNGDLSGILALGLLAAGLVGFRAGSGMRRWQPKRRSKRGKK